MWNRNQREWWFCTVCGRKSVKKKQQTEQSVNNWTELYQSAKELTKTKPRKKVVAKKEKEETLAEYEKDYVKRLKKKPRKKEKVDRDTLEAWQRTQDIYGYSKQKPKPQKKVSSPVLPQSSFSFSGRRLPIFLIAGFVIGVIMFAIIGSMSVDPYGCTNCDVFSPGYDGPPPIYMDDLYFGP